MKNPSFHFPKRSIYGFTILVYTLFLLCTPISRAQTTFNFGNVPLGATATIKSSFYFSTGIPVDCTNTVLTGIDTNDYIVSPDFNGASFPAGQTNSFTITFSPSHLGTESANETLSLTPGPGYEAWFIPFDWIWHLTGTVVPSVAVITPLRVTASQADLSAPPSDINTPILARPDTNYLDADQMPLGLGVVADGVTPVLFKMQLKPGTYTISLTATDAASLMPCLYDGHLLLTNLLYLTTNSWSHNPNDIIYESDGSNRTTYILLTGLDWSHFYPTTGPSNQVNATLSVNSGTQKVAKTTFAIRPPPILLVHGIADTGATWSDAFRASLADHVPADFIVPITYGPGQGKGFIAAQHWPCTVAPFENLAIEVDGDIHAVEVGLQNWDFTRYDAVGHSQGGVLLRMLCQTVGTTAYAPFTSDHVPVVSAENFYRGRFRRIVTIGSPHGGSAIMYYLDHMSMSAVPIDIAKYNIVDFVAPAIKKFDPNEHEVRRINNPDFPVDSRIAFHCVQATINGGHSPVTDEAKNPQIYNLYGLSHKILTGHYAGLSRGQIIFPLGSDGVVDVLSQGGNDGTPQGVDFTNIAHAVGGILFGVPDANHTETASGDVGTDVADLLSGPDSNFGTFYLPPLITQAETQVYDGLVPGIHTLLGLVTRLVTPHDVSTNINYSFSIPLNLPAETPVNWRAVIYDSNGIDTNGVSVQVNPNDSTLMTLGVDGNVVGQVLVAADYMTTNGDLVFAPPFIAVSRQPFYGAAITNIECEPSSIALGVGDTIPIQIWGNYTGGVRSLLYATPSQVSYVSSNPQVVGVDTNGNATLYSQGAATISVTYEGFTSKTTIATTPSLTPQILFAGKMNENYGFSLFGSYGTTNIVQTSTNLTDWSAIATILITNELTVFVDTTAYKSSKRFYRVVSPTVSTNFSIGN